MIFQLAGKAPDVYKVQNELFLSNSGGKLRG